jgi:hypothetical protein
MPYRDTGHVIKAWYIRFTKSLGGNHSGFVLSYEHYLFHSTNRLYPSFMWGMIFVYLFHGRRRESILLQSRDLTSRTDIALILWIKVNLHLDLQEKRFLGLDNLDGDVTICLSVVY